MFTLSDASKTLKEVLKWVGLILASFILLFMIWKVILLAKNMFFPAPQAKPQTAFGKLQLQIFPESKPSSNLKFSLNTLSGQFPSFPSQAKVFRIEGIQPDLLALSKFDTQAATVGFNSGYTALSDKVFEWKGNSNYSNLDRRLRFNIVTRNFSISSPYFSDPSVLSSSGLPNEQSAKTLAQTTLQNMQTLPDGIDLAKIKSNLLSIQGSFLVPATSLSNTQVIEVDFVQKDIDGIPVIYENPNSSNIKVLVTGGENQGQVVAATYIYQKLSSESSTYPLKSVTTAFDDLKKGNAYIATYNGSTSIISINNIFLAYYISSQPQDFAMPVYVFSGNDGFYAYVTAVTDEWINK